MTGAVDELIADLLDAVGARADRDQLTAIMRSAAGLAGDEPDRLDLKIAAAALAEMRAAFAMFAPYHRVSKATVFGSARTQPDDPLYQQARSVAARLAGLGWMVVTGAGPGIMAAGMEGAGRERAIGVNIRLPFEQPASELVDEERLVEMKYFFTRKLMLMKESAAFVSLPGGFGTLDETFELLTLVQTGKTRPAPIVLLDTPGGGYWRAFTRFLDDAVAPAGFISHDDVHLYEVAADVDQAIESVMGFYANFDSQRYIGGRLVLRLLTAPTADELDELNADFGDIVTRGRIEVVEAHSSELADDDVPDLPRLRLSFDRRSHGRLHHLIRRLGRLPSAEANGPARERRRPA